MHIIIHISGWKLINYPPLTIYLLHSALIKINTHLFNIVKPMRQKHNFRKNKQIFKNWFCFSSFFPKFATSRLAQLICILQKNLQVLIGWKTQCTYCGEIHLRQQTCKRHWFWLQRHGSVCGRNPIMTIDQSNRTIGKMQLMKSTKIQWAIFQVSI